ncbi:MAG: MFS transporter [Sphingopyxis sp.]|nr:MFS transporter [Sphingopyxis sp.]
MSTASPTTSLTSPRVMLWTLLIIYIFNFLDRQIVNILAEPISRELGLNDTQIGLMTGLAFALFYTILGIPIARYADRPHAHRVNIIAISLAAWSAMTALCGMAQNFVQLLLARIGVGVGEAGCTPAAMSLITDSVPPEKRSSAIAFYGLGVPIGSLLGLVVGGVLADAYGWRIAFFAVGLPGVLLALLVPLMIRDPRFAGGTGPQRSASPPALGFGAALREMAQSRTFVLLMLGAAFTAFLAYGKTTWAVILFQRTHGLSPGETGLFLGVTIGLAGILGTWLGGVVADRFGARDKRYIILAPAIGMAIAAPLLYVAYASNDWRWALALLIVPTILNSMYYGPTYGAVQGLVRPEARATASAIMLLAQNLIGLGLGPLLFGFLSDQFRPIAGVESVRWVLYGAAWLGLIPAALFWFASRGMARDLKSG